MVSNIGRVKTVDVVCPSRRDKQPTQLRRGRIISAKVGENGYLCFKTKVQDRIVRSLVHRLVALAFVDGHFDGATVDHIDGDRLNNVSVNLEWVTRAENSRRQNQDGRGVPKGEKHPNAKLTDDDARLAVDMRKAGTPVQVVAERFGVSTALIYKIAAGTKRTYLAA